MCLWCLCLLWGGKEGWSCSVPPSLTSLLLALVGSKPDWRDTRLEFGFHHRRSHAPTCLAGIVVFTWRSWTTEVLLSLLGCRSHSSFSSGRTGPAWLTSGLLVSSCVRRMELFACSHCQAGIWGSSMAREPFLGYSVPAWIRPEWPAKPYPHYCLFSHPLQYLGEWYQWELLVVAGTETNYFPTRKRSSVKFHGQFPPLVKHPLHLAFFLF